MIPDLIVKVFATTYEPDYVEPWRTPARCESTGSGFIIEQGLIVTNAHVVANAFYITVRLATKSQRYRAAVQVIDHHCDLALLRVDDPEFIRDAKVANIGSMVQLLDSVQVVGFPMGGEELSITMGIVSRIEINTYEQAGVALLTAQVDAAINQGNSGGPVFSNNEVVGIAFQGFDDGQNLGYMIPTPILKHFLQEAMHAQADTNTYKGFPNLNILVENMENHTLRAIFGMHDAQSGVRVRKVYPLSSAYQKVLIDDVILAVDDNIMNNDGTMCFESLGSRINFRHAFYSKFIGDSVKLTVLRDKKILDLHLTLKHTAVSTLLVPAIEYVKYPSYFIASGVVFQPLTYNYMNTEHGEYIEKFLSMEYGSIHLMPKQNTNEQLIFINCILESDESLGYDVSEFSFVDKVNGKKINNLIDVIDAIESNKGKYHTIYRKNGSLIMIKAMQQAEHQALLANYGISADRSLEITA